MLGDHLLIDAHVHVPVLGSVAPAWVGLGREFGPDGILERVWDAEGHPVPAALDELFEEQGVDAALLFCEYSPKATGYQLFDDLLPLVEHHPERFRPVANVNPHLHFPIARELTRQLDHGAAALKLHPVHGGFRCDDRALWPAYQVLAERGVPLVVHCGTSTFPGSMNELAHPEHLLPVVRDFPRSTWCWRTAGGAGGTTRPRSWRWPTRTSGSSCPGCPRAGCPTTTRASTSPGWPAGGSSRPTGPAYLGRRGTRRPSPTSAPTTRRSGWCSPATRCGCTPASTTSRPPRVD